MGVGTAAFITRVNIWVSDPYFDNSDINSPAGPISMLICAMMMVASVPSFIISGVNKRKGMSISIKNETAPYYQQGILLSKNISSLSLKIGL